MRELLEGRRFGFALRPLLGGVALGLAFAITLLDLMAWFAWGSRETNGFVIAASWLCVAAALVALLAMFAAYAENADVPFEDRQLARLDLAGVGVAMLLYAGSAILRSFDLNAAGATPPALLLALAGLIVLLVGSGLGSLLYAAREWEEIEEVIRERHHRRRA
ncbi:MAG: hypothetical protein HYX56_06345 [Chloroflexi bacterium]|nr:hypothetical protein [Chloroflexota bacterium]